MTARTATGTHVTNPVPFELKDDLLSFRVLNENLATPTKDGAKVRSLVQETARSLFVLEAIYKDILATDAGDPSRFPNSKAQNGECLVGEVPDELKPALILFGNYWLEMPRPDVVSAILDIRAQIEAVTTASDDPDIARFQQVLLLHSKITMLEAYIKQCVRRVHPDIVRFKNCRFCADWQIYAK